MASGLEKHLRAFSEGHVIAAILGEGSLDIGTGGMLSHDPGLILVTISPGRVNPVMWLSKQRCFEMESRN